MPRAVCQMAIALLLTAASVALAAGPAEPQNNSFEAPILDVRPRVFIRQGSFEGLTVAKLREAARQPEFAEIRAKWKRRPLGQAIEWMITGDRLRPELLSDLPRAELFGRDSCGYGFFRSHWPSPGKPDDATHVFFRCGDPLDVHGGVAAGEFQIFKYAPLAARSGRYASYDSPADQYHRNCISANVVLFTDPADPDDRGDQNSRRGLKHDHKTWAIGHAKRCFCTC